MNKYLTYELPDGGTVFGIIHLMPRDVLELTSEETLTSHAGLKSVDVPMVDDWKTAQHRSIH